MAAEAVPAAPAAVVAGAVVRGRPVAAPPPRVVVAVAAEEATACRTCSRCICLVSAAPVPCADTAALRTAVAHNSVLTAKTISLSVLA